MTDVEEVEDETTEVEAGEEEEGVEVEDVASLSKRKQRKHRYRKKLIECFAEYKNILVVGIDNVGSSQMQKIRMALRGDAVLLMGKKTLIRKIIREQVGEKPQLEALVGLVRGNVGFVFTNGDLNKIRKAILENKVPAAAKTGALAPCDVFVAPGPTGLDPAQTSFFQALNIQTKIAKGSIEILNQVHLIKAGDKVTASAVALLAKLNMKPFFYGMTVKTVWENGSVYSASVLDLTDALLFKSWYKGVAHVAALSLMLGMPTKASIACSIRNAFKRLLAITFETSYTFPQAEAFKSGAAAAAASGDGEEEAEEEEAEEEEEEAVESEGPLGLFD